MTTEAILAMLKPFCSTESHRTNMHQPFSNGAFLYATDARIAVRVRKPEDFTELNAPNILPPDPAALPISTASHCLFTELPPLPPPDNERCPHCKEVLKPKENLTIDGALFQNNYLHLIASLPHARIGPLVNQTLDNTCTMLPFRFEGGEGLLCSMRRS